ncbi:hypothetical protein FOA52_000861 [Chlamydomonas sp. UWO 241]|nr:hypothetical protein FOA52_000861 [Chlamydomonas sp. UWO 241]
MRTIVARVRVPGWLRLVDASILVAGLCWSVWAVYTFHTADALALCVANGAALVSVLSPQFSLEAHCFVPVAWSLGGLAAAIAAELVWSKLDTGVFALAEKPAMNSFLKSPGCKAEPALLLLTVYKITTILLCTESGPSRCAVSCYQAWASVASHLILNGLLATQAAFGFPIDAALQTELAIVAATECGALLLLLLLLTPAAAAPTHAADKAESATPERMPALRATHPTDDPAHAGASAPADDPASAGVNTRAPANDTVAMARAAVPVAPSTCDGAQQPEYHSRTRNRSVAFTAKFPSLHLADHPAVATPEWRDTLSARFSSMLSEQASLQRGAPVSLRVMQLSVGAGCVVVHGRVFENGAGVRASSDEVAAMLRAMCVSDVLMRLLPEGARLLDGDTAVLQLGDGAPPMELAFNAADGRFLEAPRSDQPPPVLLPGVPLLSATWPLLALPTSGSGRVHLQFGTALLARSLGHDPELVVSWVPSGAPASPSSLVRARVTALQAAARARGNPPGLIDIDVDLGPRPSHGVFIAQLVDGGTLLDAHSVPLLPASAHVVVAELLRARLPVDTMHSVAHDLSVLLCGPRMLTLGDAAEVRLIVSDLMAWESTCRPALPALRALLDGLLHKLDVGDTEPESSPSSSSSVDTLPDAATPRLNHPVFLFGCWMFVIVCATKAAQFGMDGSSDAALAMFLHCLPYALAAMPANNRLSALLPRALRTVDACAARRVFTMALTLATMPVIGDLGRWTAYCKYGGDIPMLLFFAWCEPPRSPAMGAAISLLVEVPMMSLFRWYTIAGSGNPTSASQALVEVGMCAFLLVAFHVTVWWTPSTPRAGTRAGGATKLKVA